MKLIDKDALVAEIERTQKRLNIDDIGGRSVMAWSECFKNFIDTLEVKEVDLEKEIDKFYGIYRKNGRTYSIEDNEECLDWKVDCNPNFEKAFAKHFFELGLLARADKELVEDSHIDSIKDTADRMT